MSYRTHFKYVLNIRKNYYEHQHYFSLRCNFLKTCWYIFYIQHQVKQQWEWQPQIQRPLLQQQLVPTAVHAWASLALNVLISAVQAVTAIFLEVKHHSHQQLLFPQLLAKQQLVSTAVHAWASLALNVQISALQAVAAIFLVDFTERNVSKFSNWFWI